MQEQLSLFITANEGNQLVNFPEIFRSIYYHLYTNSKASRAELIIEDLGLLLLSKLAVEVNGGHKALDSFIAGEGDANGILLPMLRKTYPDLLDKNHVFSLGEQPLRAALEELAHVQLSKAPAHALGEAFQALMGPRLRGEKGQFFTPKSLVKAMAEIVNPTTQERVLDPACGTGGFLAQVCVLQEERLGKGEKISTLVGVDKDRGLSRLAAAILHLLSGKQSTVLNFNSLDLSEWEKERKQSPFGKFDVVLTNPPFGARIGVKEPAVLKQYDFGYVWIHDKQSGDWHRTQALAASQDPQILFLEFCVRCLKPGGRMGIVLPEGLFGNKNTAYIWDWIEQMGEVSGLLDCPRTTFQPGTDTKTNVLFFERFAEGKSTARRKTKVSVALHCGHDRRGRSHLPDGQPCQDDFTEIASAFHSKKQDVWKMASLRGKRYLVPRYYFEQRTVSDAEKALIESAPIVTLGELVAEGILTIRKGHEVGSEAYGTGTVPFVRTSDIANYEIRSDPTKAISDEIYKSFQFQQNLTPGDALIVVDGRYRIGSTAILTPNNCRCVVQSHLRILSCADREAVDPYEVLFALNLPSVRLRIRNLVFIQSTLGTLGNRLLELQIPLLHGEGPWKESLIRFRHCLQERDILLAELNTMSASEVEL